MKLSGEAHFVQTAFLVMIIWSLAGCGGGEGVGTLSILGTGDDSFELLDMRRNKIASGKTSTQLTIPAGSYMVVVNGSGKSVRIASGSTATVALGSVVVAGAGDGTYEIHDPTGQKTLASRAINKPMELQPGEYVAMLYQDGMRITVKPRQRTVIRAGTLAVIGSKHTFYTVYDQSGTQKMDFRSATRTIDLLPGTYQVQAGGRTFKVEIKAGETNTLNLSTASP